MKITTAMNSTKLTSKKQIKQVTYDSILGLKYREPTESQLQLIEKLKGQLAEKDVDLSFLAEPTDNMVAQHIIQSLLRLCKKYGIRKEKND